MLIYWLVLAGSVIIGYPLCKIKFGKEIYCVLCGVVLFLIAGMRWAVGFDYFNYSAIYRESVFSTLKVISKSRIEKGFLINVKLLSDYFTQIQVLFWVVAFVVAAAAMLFIYFRCEKPYLGVFCFLCFGIFFMSMDFLRQTIAALIILLGIKFIERNQVISFVVVVLLASCFHISAFIMLPFFFILRIKMNWVTLGLYTAVIILVFMFSWDIMEFATRYVYTGYDPEVSGEMKVGIDPIYALIEGTIFMTAFLLREDIRKRLKSADIFLNFMFFEFFFTLVGVRHAVISRFTLLFCIPAFTVLVPQILLVILDKISHKFKGDTVRQTVSKTVAVVAAVAVCSAMYSYMLATNYNGVVPYRTVYAEK